MHKKLLSPRSRCYMRSIRMQIPAVCSRWYSPCRHWQHVHMKIIQWVACPVHKQPQLTRPENVAKKRERERERCIFKAGWKKLHCWRVQVHQKDTTKENSGLVNFFFFFFYPTLFWGKLYCEVCSRTMWSFIWNTWNIIEHIIRKGRLTKVIIHQCPNGKLKWTEPPDAFQEIQQGPIWTQPRAIILPTTTHTGLNQNKDLPITSDSALDSRSFWLMKKRLTISAASTRVPMILTLISSSSCITIS